eukprot:8624036-Alexandrium_andersonii.AAC.1
MAPELQQGHPRSRVATSRQRPWPSGTPCRSPGAPPATRWRRPTAGARARPPQYLSWPLRFERRNHRSPRSRRTRPRGARPACRSPCRPSGTQPRPRTSSQGDRPASRGEEAHSAARG